MHAYDPMDWTHQWDRYEMMMYALTGPTDAGIYMQVSERAERDGAEEWNILYSRKIADLPSGIQGPVGSEQWEDQVLRQHFTAHPELVDEEKSHLAAWLERHS
ncbi:MAG: hypothetical protein K6T78_01235 [Alicyclobacillus sp.]|nr:hypothetical protein [Alicyclobacillus sp.]